MKAIVIFDIRHLLPDLEKELALYVAKRDIRYPFEQLKTYWIVDRLMRIHLQPIIPFHLEGMDAQTHHDIRQLSPHLDSVLFDTVKIPLCLADREGRVELRYVDLYLHFD